MSRTGKIVTLLRTDTIRARVADGLAAEGFEVLSLPTTPDALDAPASQGIGVILVEVSDDGDGVRLISRARDLWPDIEIVGIVDDASSDAALAALRSGASACLSEPLSVERLVQVARCALDRGRVLETLREEQRRYQRLVDSAPIGVFEIQDGRIAFLNRYLVELSGFEVSDLLGRPPTEFVTPEDRARLEENLKNRLEDRVGEGPSVYRFRTKRGATFEGEVRLEIIRIADGVRLEGTVRDVTVERRLQRLNRAAIALGETLLAERDIDRILRMVLDAITEHAGFRRAVVSLYDLSSPDPFEGEVYKMLGVGVSEADLGGLREGGGLSPEERKHAFHERFELGAAFYVPHGRGAWDPDKGLKGTISLGAWHKDDFLFIPLRGERNIIGHISVDDPDDPAAPTEASIEPLAALAGFAALAVERSYKLRQLQRQTDRLHGFSQFGRDLYGVGSIRELCQTAAERLRDDMEYDYCSIVLIDGSELVIEGVAGCEGFPTEGLSPVGTRAALEGPGIGRWVLHNGKPLLVNDVAADPRYHRVRGPVRSEIDVPILDRRGVVGVINVENRRPGAFSPMDTEILTAFAGQLSVAISGFRRQAALSGIQALGQDLTRVADARSLIESTLAFLTERFDFQNMELFLVEGDDLVVQGLREGKAKSDLALGEIWPKGKGVVGWVSEHRCPALIDDAAADPRYVAGIAGTRSELAVPVMNRGELLGVLNIESDRVGFFDEEDRQMLDAAANELSIAIANLKLREDLREQATRDPLTGLYNRHYFNEVVRSELDRADRYEHPVSIMMIDIDGFREVNNRLGHLRGDEILRRVAEILINAVRSTDIVIRYGGDEFLVLMPETNGESVRVATRLKERIAEPLPLSRLGGLTVGLSIGIVVRDPGDPRSLEGFLAEADRRMYADKRAGRPDCSDAYRH